MFTVEDEEVVREQQPSQSPVNQPPAKRETGSKPGGPANSNFKTQTGAPVISLQSVQNVQKSNKVMLVEPHSYADAQEVAEHLKNKRTVVVNLQRVERDQGFRIIDFLSGTVYALDGDIRRIGTDIFICAPEHVEVDGAISNFRLEE